MAKLGPSLSRFLIRMPGGRRSARLGLHGKRAFRAIIERERSRADRNSHGFSLAVFNVLDVRRDQEVAKLARTLCERSRFTDEVGWLNDREIGVLLPDTYTEGARKFTDHVRCALSGGDAPPPCRVYVYEPVATRTAANVEDDRQLVFEDLLANVEPLPEAGTVEEAQQDERRFVRAAPESETAPTVVCGGIEEFAATPRMVAKRLFDVVGAGIAFLLLSPVMGAVALLIRIVSPGPVIFRQERIGHGGRRFTCLKFRTMHLNHDVSGHRDYFRSLIGSSAPMKKLDTGEDPRLIPFGRVIRSLALDELPQLVNVLRGDMSLIGPRPCIPYEYEDFDRWHRQRVFATPGMTGLWQVSGKNRLSFEEMMRLDIRYARRSSLLMDAGIVLKTVPVLMEQLREGVARRAENEREERRTVEATA